MKKLLILPLWIVLIHLNAQHDQLSTFEEMWIVSPEFKHSDMQPSVSLAPESMTAEKMNSVKSFADFNKIIADTPFLSLTFGKPSSKFIKSHMESKGPIIALNERLEPGKSYKGWGSWLVVFKKGDDYVIGIPTNDPDKLKSYFETNNFLITDETSKLDTLAIKEVRIENGTYGKTN